MHSLHRLELYCVLMTNSSLALVSLSNAKRHIKLFDANEMFVGICTMKKKNVIRYIYIRHSTHLAMKIEMINVNFKRKRTHTHTYERVLYTEKTKIAS